jgi:hypothetical protein
MTQPPALSVHDLVTSCLVGRRGQRRTRAWGRCARRRRRRGARARRAQCRGRAGGEAESSRHRSASRHRASVLAPRSSFRSGSGRARGKVATVWSRYPRLRPEKSATLRATSCRYWGESATALQLRHADRAREVGALQRRAGQDRVGQVRVGQVRIAQVRIGQIGVLEVGMAQARRAPRDADELDFQAGLAQLGSARGSPVCGLARCSANAEHGRHRGTVITHLGPPRSLASNTSIVRSQVHQGTSRAA